MFNFFKKRDRFITYEQPVVIVNSLLPGFKNFVVGKESQNPIPWMRIVEEEEIPYGRVYFKYMGNGKCKRSMKHDPFPQGKLAASTSLDIRNSVNDHTYGVNSFGAEYTQSEMFRVCFNLRNDILGR